MLYLVIGGAMSAVKITKIGNSQGLTIPKDILEKGNFELGDTLELVLYNGRMILFKKPQHHSQMKFDGKQDESEIEWADADLGEWDE